MIRVTQMYTLWKINASLKDPKNLATLGNANFRSDAGQARFPAAKDSRLCDPSHKEPVPLVTARFPPRHQISPGVNRWEVS